MTPQRCVYLKLRGTWRSVSPRRRAGAAGKRWRRFRPTCSCTDAAMRTTVQPRRAVTAPPLTQESHLPGGLCKALDLGADTVAYGGVDTLREDPRQARLDALESRRRCFDK